MDELEIRHKVYIKTDLERVYKTLTTAEGWDAWFTNGTEIGTEFIKFKWVEYGPDRVTTEDGGKITTLIPNQHFAFEWKPGDSITTVTFTLNPNGDGTILEVHETGYSSSKQDLIALANCAAGWGEALTLLRFYLEFGVTYNMKK